MKLYDWLVTIGNIVVNNRGVIDWTLPVKLGADMYMFRVSIDRYRNLTDSQDSSVVMMKVCPVDPVGVLEVGEPGEKEDYRRILLKATCWRVEDDEQTKQKVEQLEFKLVRYDQEIWNVVLYNRKFLQYSDSLMERINQDLVEGFRSALDRRKQ